SFSVPRILFTICFQIGKYNPYLIPSLVTSRKTNIHVRAKVGTYLASFLGVKEVSAIWNGYQLLGDSDKTVRELRSTAWKIAKTLLYAWVSDVLCIERDYNTNTIRPRGGNEL